MRLKYFILFFLTLFSQVCLSAQTLQGQLMLFTHEDRLQFDNVLSKNNFDGVKKEITGQKKNFATGLEVNAILPLRNNIVELFFYLIALVTLLYLLYLISTYNINQNQYAAGQEHKGKEIAFKIYGKTAKFQLGTFQKLSPQFTDKISPCNDFGYNIPVSKETNHNGKTDIHGTCSLRRTEYTKYPAGKDMVAEKLNKKELILVVEDQDDYRDYLVLMLRNYRILSCSNGRDALKLAREYLPDLILSNVLMPEMNGFELCDEIKNNHITSHIIVILLSEKQDSSQKLWENKHSADAFIEIPFSMNSLLLQVNNLLKTKRMLQAKFTFNSVESINYDALMEMDRQFLNKVKEIVKSKLTSNELSVETISQEVGMSRSQLYRKFKTLTEITPKEYITVARLEKSVELLSALRYTVNEVAFKTGFYDGSHFGTVFKMQFGITPKQFIEQLNAAKKRSQSRVSGY